VRPNRANRAADAWASFRTYPERESHTIVGLMTGTSADAVDAALVRFEGGRGLGGRHELLAYRETPIDHAMHDEILDVASSDTVALERLLELDAALGRLYADAVIELLRETGIEAKDVDAIGSHGQTVRHVPRAGGAETRTLQIGSAARLAERTGIAVVSDFRSRDAAAGGEGAPLVPLVDWWLFRSETQTRVLLNLGGMANVTLLPRGTGAERVVAFDTGPGNAVIDALARFASNGAQRFDEGGAAAARGRPAEGLLAELLADPWFAQPPPRSTGRERFGERYASKLREVGNEMGLSDNDVLATAVELTSASVAGAVEQFLAPAGPIDAVFASGGGVHNAVLMQSLERRLSPARVRTLAALGVPPEAKEALAFAFLAHMTLLGQPGNVPIATGARHPVVLGSVTPGAPR